MWLYTHTHTHTDNFREKGITLIALVVTIAVIMILAGISINAIVGDDGLIKKAQKSADLSNEADAKETINRAILEFYTTREYATLYDFLKTKEKNGTIDSVEENSDGTLTISKNGYTVNSENKTNSYSKNNNTSGGTGESTGGSTSGSTSGETQVPTITISGTKVVSNRDGTGLAVGKASTYLGNTLYINFESSITGGTTTVSPRLPYAVTANGTYDFTVTGTVNGNIYTKDVSVTVNQFKDSYEYMPKNTKVTYPDGNVWVPEGFKIADDSASTVQGGVVIEDKDQNQFVWIPVAGITDYKRTWYSGSTYNPTSETLPSDEQLSVSTYKGYYIGRYEAGDKESTVAKTLRASGASTSNKITIKANQAPYNYVKKAQAQTLAESFGTQQGYKAKTKLVSSYAWDTAIEFIQESVSNYGTSSPQGNYIDIAVTYADITGQSETKSSGVGRLIPTGQTTPVCNIYDMGGNISEWTTESHSETGSPYTCRGGYHDDYYDKRFGRPPCLLFRRCLCQIHWL